MDDLSSGPKISRVGETSPNSKGNLRDVSWAVKPPLRADGSPQKDYRKYILSQRCVRCGAAGGKAQRIVLDGWWCLPGHEVSDAYLLPLCKKHDEELTHAPNKSHWWLTEEFHPVAEAVWFLDNYHATAYRWMRSEANKTKTAKKQT